MSNDPTLPVWHVPTLSFLKRPIRTISIDRVLWFSLSDLADVLFRPRETVEAIAARPSFPSHAKMECIEATEDGDRTGILVSPVGVFLLTAFIDPARGQGLAAWARKNAKEAYPDATPDDRRMFLSLNDDGSIPPKPMRYTGRLEEWHDLVNRTILARTNEIMDRFQRDAA